MGLKIAGSGGNEAEVDSRGALRTISIPIGGLSHACGRTSLMAAGLAQSAPVFAFRSSISNTKYVYIWKMNLQWVTITAFTTPVTGGRSLELWRYSGDDFSGGTTLAPVGKDWTGTTGLISDMRISTTAALTAGGSVAYGSYVEMMKQLTNVGNAGNATEWTWGGNTGGNTDVPLCMLSAGQGIVIRNSTSQAMDAVGTWNLTVNIEWSELDEAYN